MEIEWVIACGGKAVQEYRFDCLDAGGLVTQSHRIGVASDDDATEIGKRLLGETQCEVVEVWHEVRLVHRCVRSVLGP